MATYSVEFLDKVDELTYIAAKEGLSVNVLVRPVLCPMDDKAASLASLFGAFMGQSFYDSYKPEIKVTSEEPQVK